MVTPDDILEKLAHEFDYNLASLPNINELHGQIYNLLCVGMTESSALDYARKIINVSIALNIREGE